LSVMGGGGVLCATEQPRVSGAFSDRRRSGECSVAVGCRLPSDGLDVGRVDGNLLAPPTLSSRWHAHACRHISWSHNRLADVCLGYRSQADSQSWLHVASLAEFIVYGPQRRVGTWALSGLWAFVSHFGLGDVRSRSFWCSHLVLKGLSHGRRGSFV